MRTYVYLKEGSKLIMGYVYRYTDLADNTIKYVGVVYSQNRTLEDRIREHKSDDWCKCRRWKIEYINENIITRTDAEYFEAHYIALFGTDKYFNIKKSGWGTSSFLPDRTNDWILYCCEYANLRQDNEKLLHKKLEECQKQLIDTKKELIQFKNKIAEYTIASHSQYIVNINTTFDQNLLYAINWLRRRYNHFNTFSKKSGVKKECPHIFDAIKYLLLENYDIDGRTLDSYFGGYAPEYIKEIEEKDIEKMLEMSYALFIPIIPNDSNDKIKKGYPLSVTFYCKGQNFGTYIYNSIKEFR